MPQTSLVGSAAASLFRGKSDGAGGDPRQEDDPHQEELGHGERGEAHQGLLLIVEPTDTFF